MIYDWCEKTLSCSPDQSHVFGSIACCILTPNEITHIPRPWYLYCLIALLALVSSPCSCYIRCFHQTTCISTISGCWLSISQKSFELQRASASSTGRSRTGEWAVIPPHSRCIKGLHIVLIVGPHFLSRRLSKAFAINARCDQCVDWPVTDCNH